MSNDPPGPTPEIPSRPFSVARVSLGFVAGIACLFLTPVIGAGVLLLPIVGIIMLFFWNTRSFGIGLLLAVGTALLLLVAICGGHIQM